MLSFEHNTMTGKVRLPVRTGIVEAWISYYPPALKPYDRQDWRLYVRHRPSEPPRTGKSETFLLVESRLRAWLLQHFHRRLRDLSFEELLAIAQREYLTPKRRMRLGWKNTAE
jgi:hypothetical protein